MNINKTSLLVIGGVLIIVVAGAVQFLYPRPAVSPTTSTVTSTTEQNATTTTTPATSVIDVKVMQKSPTAYPLSFVEGESITEWDFKGAYTDNPELVAKAQSEIERLSEQLATATSSAMILSVSIANQYELIGDGKKQYEYLERAIRTNPENGLPWHNLGVLMEKLGAYKTARIAYEKSTLVQPEFKFYHYAYIEFLTTRMKDDTISIEKAFKFAEDNIGKTSWLVELRTEWQRP
jgi:hypothetical protein